MKRDMALVRKILETVEDGEGPVGVGEWDSLGESLDGRAERERLRGHLRLLVGAGYVELREGDKLGEPLDCITCHLTWAGHSYLDELRMKDKGVTAITGLCYGYLPKTSDLMHGEIKVVDQTPKATWEGNTAVNSSGIEFGEGLEVGE